MEKNTADPQAAERRAKRMALLGWTRESEIPEHARERPSIETFLDRAEEMGDNAATQLHACLCSMGMQHRMTDIQQAQACPWIVPTVDGGDLVDPSRPRPPKGMRCDLTFKGSGEQLQHLFDSCCNGGQLVVRNLVVTPACTTAKDTAGFFAVLDKLALVGRITVGFDAKPVGDPHARQDVCVAMIKAVGHSPKVDSFLLTCDTPVLDTPSARAALAALVQTTPRIHLVLMPADLSPAVQGLTAAGSSVTTASLRAARYPDDDANREEKVQAGAWADGWFADLKHLLRSLPGLRSLSLDTPAGVGASFLTCDALTLFLDPLDLVQMSFIGTPAQSNFGDLVKEACLERNRYRHIAPAATGLAGKILEDSRLTDLAPYLGERIAAVARSDPRTAHSVLTSMPVPDAATIAAFWARQPPEDALCAVMVRAVSKFLERDWSRFVRADVGADADADAADQNNYHISSRLMTGLAQLHECLVGASGQQPIALEPVVAAIDAQLCNLLLPAREQDTAPHAAHIDASVLLTIEWLGQPAYSRLPDAPQPPDVESGADVLFGAVKQLLDHQAEEIGDYLLYAHPDAGDANAKRLTDVREAMVMQAVRPLFVQAFHYVMSRLALRGEAAPAALESPQ